MPQGGYKIADQFATYFLTFTLVGWVDLFTRRQCCQILIDSFNYCKENKGLILYAYVIMGSHVHLIASAREGSSGLSAIVRDFKSHTSRKIIEWITETIKKAGENGLKWFLNTMESIIPTIRYTRCGSNIANQCNALPLSLPFKS